MNKYQLNKLKRLSKNQIKQICVSFAKKIDPIDIARVYDIDTVILLHIVASTKTQPSEAAQLKLSYIEGKTLTELSKTYNLTVSAVHYHVKSLAEDRRENKRRLIIEPIRQGYLGGETVGALAKKYKQTKARVYYWVKDLSPGQGNYL